MTTISSVCVFCGSRKGADPAFEAAARDLGVRLAERRIRLVYGGGGIGLMGAITDAVIEHGGQVTGIIPDFLMKHEVGHAGVTDLIVVGSMHDRKRAMFERSDGFVVLPGGLGTLDETFEIITWKQLRLHDKPIVVLDVAGYWQSLKQLVETAIHGGFAHPAISGLFTVVDRVEDVIATLESAPEPKEEVLTDHL